ncbi:MAG: NADP-specific glutamate dehydrogenase [Alphaproteobacteria bacterium]
MQYKDYLKHSHPHSEEFHQAVNEIFEDIEEFYGNDARYKQANILERLIEPDRIIRFRVCWEDDNHDIQVNRGWRVQFNNALGAYKGGLRFHPDVNESVLKFLGFEQCFKNALTGLPMGGGKGGSDFNPKGRSDREIMRFCHAFMDELYRHIAPDIDVPAGDINVGAREIGYLFGRYLKITNEWEGVITGKSPAFGGSCGRVEATGYGVVYFLKEMLAAHEDTLEGKSVLISGAGNVALHVAEKCLQEKCNVLSVSDSKGVLYFKDGMNEKQLREIKEQKLDNHGALKDMTIGEYKKDAKPWDVENADIALPCATQNEIDENDARTLAKNNILAVIEGANMPLTAKAKDIIRDNNILCGPGKAVNAGGVAVSGLERAQNASLESWGLEEVDQKLQEIMKNIHARCIEHIEKKEGIYPYHKGANIYGFKKLADTLLAYGVK